MGPLTLAYRNTALDTGHRGTPHLNKHVRWGVPLSGEPDQKMRPGQVAFLENSITHMSSSRTHDSPV